MPTRLKVAIVAFSFFCFGTVAEAACQEDLLQYGRTDFQKFDFDGKCYIKVSPMETSGLRYRQYYFFESGKLMVFNSFGPGGSQNTGARTFFILPSTKDLKWQPDGDKIWIESSNASFKLRFNAQISNPDSVLNGGIKVDPKIDPNNQGGMEFSNLKSTYLDFGFKRGTDPAANSNGRSILYDFKGNSCRLMNSQVLRYNASGDYELKFQGSDLKRSLQIHCPRLDLSQLID